MQPALHRSRGGGAFAFFFSVILVGVALAPADAAPGGRHNTTPRMQRHRDRDGDGRGDRHRGGGIPRRDWWRYRSGFYGDSFFYGIYAPRMGAYGYRQERERDSGENITINVSPKNTSVFVNGLLYSSKGRARFNLPIGTWKIELQAPGHSPQSLEIKVDQGIRYIIERKLDRDPGRDGPIDPAPAPRPPA